jgi:hypothetical protein
VAGLKSIALVNEINTGNANASMRSQLSAKTMLITTASR